MANEPFPTLDTESLEAITGGTTSSDQITTMMQSLSSSIQGLASNQNNSGSALTQMLPMLMLARGSGGGAAAAPAAAAGGPCPCGCGMANCAPR